MTIEREALCVAMFKPLPVWNDQTQTSVLGGNIRPMGKSSGTKKSMRYHYLLLSSRRTGCQPEFEGGSPCEIS